MKFKYILCILLLLLVAKVLASDSQNKCNDKPSQTGPCKAAFTSWRFIKKDQVCESFLYGGCQATRNIFEDEEECTKMCLG